MIWGVWPFSRLVHAWSYPLWYLWRPYVVYRSRIAGAPGRARHRRPQVAPDRRPVLMDDGTGVAVGQARSPGRAATAIRDLHPGYFAFVMATGIISTGTFLLGPSWLSRALLVVASAGLVVLSAALVIRLVRFRPSVAADIHAPEAGLRLLHHHGRARRARRPALVRGHPLTTAILAGLAAAVWLVLTYGVPASLLLTRARDSVLGGVNGTWLLWVVSTQSLAVTASALVSAWPSQSGLLAPFATALWSIGLVLYLLLVSLILLRWLTVAMTPQTLGPPYWILMGATAITVLAGAKILGLPGTLPAVQATAVLRRGVLLRPVGVRHLVDPVACRARVSGATSGSAGRSPTSRRCGAWSSRSACTAWPRCHSARPARLAFMEPLSRFMLWVAVAAWVTGRRRVPRPARPPAR